MDSEPAMLQTMLNCAASNLGRCRRQLVGLRRERPCHECRTTRAPVMIGIAQSRQERTAGGAPEAKAPSAARAAKRPAPPARAAGRTGRASPTNPTWRAVPGSPAARHGTQLHLPGRRSSQPSLPLRGQRPGQPAGAPQPPRAAPAALQNSRESFLRIADCRPGCSLHHCTDGAVCYAGAAEPSDAPPCRLAPYLVYDLQANRI